MSKYSYIQNGEWGEFLSVNSSKLKKTVKYIRENNVKNIELNYYNGYKLKDISFLKDCSDVIEGLIIVQGDVNLNGIEELTNLRMLNISDETKYPIDLTSFKKLERCSLLWHKNISNLSACKELRELLLKKIALSDKNIKELEPLSELTSLTFIQSKISDLNFLQVFKKIEEIQVYYTPSLTDIEGLKFCSQTIKKLLLDHCKNIVDYSPIEQLKCLEYLGITDAKEIGTMSFIKNLSSLKHLSFVGTNVLDGDMSYCLGIEFVGYDNKKHYTHTLEQVRGNS